MRQYSAIKKEHPRPAFLPSGDFYELFFDDAVLAAKELQITLTSRNKKRALRFRCAECPFHAAEGYISRLIRRGYKVAICDQVEDPRLAKKLVRREVTRVVTPGPRQTLRSRRGEQLSRRGGLLASDRAGFAALDLSTGEFRATEFSGERAC
jgi:DNA mismatch repair protein MutS